MTCTCNETKTRFFAVKDGKIVLTQKELDDLLAEVREAGRKEGFLEGLRYVPQSIYPQCPYIRPTTPAPVYPQCPYPWQDTPSWVEAPKVGDTPFSPSVTCTACGGCNSGKKEKSGRKTLME